MKCRLVEREGKGKGYTVVLNMGKDPATGKYKQRWIRVEGNKTEAEKQMIELTHQLENGILIKPNKDSFGVYLDRWMSDYAKTNLSPTTYERYEHMINRHIKPSLGNITLNQLKPEHLQHYYSEKLSKGKVNGKGGLSAKTVRHHYVTIHGALESAVKWGLLSRNIANASSPPTPQRKEMHTLKENEVIKFLEAAKATEYYALFFTALSTGMRRSELLALRWLDLELLLCKISITRSLHHLHDGTFIFRQPKTAKGRRSIVIPPATARILDQRLEARKQFLKSVNPKFDPEKDFDQNELVFRQVNGQPLLPDTVTHAWIKLVRRTGFKNIRFHDSRHTTATLLLEKNVHPKVVSEMLGHASIQITLDTYSHVTPTLQQKAALQLDHIFTGTKNQNEDFTPEKVAVEKHS